MYVTFKSTFEPEPYMYVYSYMSISERYLLAYLRIGILPLKLETGRYNNVRVEDRICELCHLHVQDENHVVHAQYMLISEKKYLQVLTIQNLMTVMIICLYFG